MKSLPVGTSIISTLFMTICLTDVPVLPHTKTQHCLGYVSISVSPASFPGCLSPPPDELGICHYGQHELKILLHKLFPSSSPPFAAMQFHISPWAPLSQHKLQRSLGMILPSLCVVLKVTQVWGSFIPRPPPFYVLQLAFSIIHRTWRTANNAHLSAFTYYTELKPKNKNREG